MSIFYSRRPINTDNKFHKLVWYLLQGAWIRYADQYNAFQNLRSNSNVTVKEGRRNLHEHFLKPDPLVSPLHCKHQKSHALSQTSYQKVSTPVIIELALMELTMAKISNGRVGVALAWNDKNKKLQPAGQSNSDLFKNLC